MDSLYSLARRTVIGLKKRLGPRQFHRFIRGLRVFKRDPLIYLGLMAVVLFVVSSSAAPSPIKTSYSLPAKDSEQTERGFLVPTEKIKESPDLTLIENNSLTAVSPPISVTPQVLGALSDGSDYQAVRREIIEYAVLDGDSIWEIAQRFNVSIDTVIWANKIDSAIIQPGQKLLILPVSGVMHLVESGDTVSGLAQKYKAEAEDIFVFNDIREEGDIFKGEVLVIPGGQMPSYSSVSIPNYSISGLSTNNFYGKSHDYPYGQCTWWVAQKRAIPAWGNAVDWLSNAERAGFSVCRGRYCIPQVGAVISLDGDKIYGHVAYVEQVKGDKVVFSEMNYIGWGKTNYRTLRMGDSRIKGYIY